MSLRLRAALLGTLLLSPPAGAVKVEVPVGEVRAGGAGNAAGAANPVGAVHLSVLPLNGTLALGGAPALVNQNSPSLAPSLQLAPALPLAPARAREASPDSRPLPAALPASVLPSADPSGPGSVLPSADPSGPAAGGLGSAGLAPGESGAAADGAALAAGRLDGSALSGAERFDGAAPRRGLLAAIKDALPWGERVPSYPGTAGERVRMGRRDMVLHDVLSRGPGFAVWGVPFGRDFAVKISRPSSEPRPAYAAERELLLRIKDNPDIRHARLLESTPDGRVMIKERYEGETAAALLGRGRFATHEVSYWADFAAGLLRAGVTADLSPSNILRTRANSKFVLLEAAGVRPAPARETLAALLDPALLAKAGVEPAAMLAMLRGRLGPGSALWRQVAGEAAALPALAPALARLAAADAGRPAPPDYVFGPAHTRAPPLNDEVVTAKEAVKRLGFDPWLSKHRSSFVHDKNKLNTELFTVKEPGKPELFLKRADWWMIQRELAVRRIISRFFGRWFEVPHALAVNMGRDSYLIMEKASGSAYGQAGLSVEQRVAFAVLANTLGLYDVNEGNVLYPLSRGKKVVLLDFEQAFGRKGPVPGRATFISELPWLDHRRRMDAEDYHAGAAAWRAFFARPGTVEALRADLAAAGYEPQEAAALIAVVAANTGELHATLQDEVEYGNRSNRE